MQDYIETHYDTENLKRIFISGYGTAWIKIGANYLDNALFCADKYHLMQYINAASKQMQDDVENVKEKLWNILYSKEKVKERFDNYTEDMMKSTNNPYTVEELRSYVLGNWSAVRRALKNKLVDGCSAKSHVSHVLSDRMSSNPMGWSQMGADRMSKLNCKIC